MKAIGLILAALVFGLSSTSRAGVSSFNEVWSVVQDVGVSASTPAEADEFSVYASGGLPQYPVNMVSLFGDDDTRLAKDAQRTINEDADYYERIKKRLHPNGVCVAGEWKITEDSPYTGLLRRHAKALFIGRVSVTMGNTDLSKKRGFGLAGKLFQTNSKDLKVRTTPFFSLDVLLGAKKNLQFLDTALTNSPPTGIPTSFSLIEMGLKIASALKSADEDPGFRPLWPLAYADVNPKYITPEWPKYFRLKVSSNYPLVKNTESDFRNEVLKALSENSKIVYDVDVSNVTNNRNGTWGWKKLGELTLNQAKVSYSCDRRLHFPHPKLRAPN